MEELQTLQSELRMRGYEGAQVIRAFETKEYRVLTFICENCFQCEMSHLYSGVNCSIYKQESTKVKIWCPRHSNSGHYLPIALIAALAWDAIQKNDLTLPVPYEEEMVSKKKEKKTSHPKKVAKVKRTIVKMP